MSSSYLLFILACLRHYTLFQVGEEELFLGKTWKLNAERNNGRGAMMGITGTPRPLALVRITGTPRPLALVSTGSVRV